MCLKAVEIMQLVIEHVQPAWSNWWTTAGEDA